jgi:protein SCO1/2
MSKKNLIILLLSFILFALGLGYYISTSIYPNQKLVETETGNALLGGDFSLLSHKGHPVDTKQFRGNYMMIYFGYSFCPDICPTALENMSEAMMKLADLGTKIQPIFVTVDPDRDTVQQLETYMQSFHPRFLALTGTKESLDKAIKSYRVYAQKVEDEGASDYLVDHSSIVYIMGPDGKYVTHFSHQTPGEEMAFKLREIIKSGP